jgi:DNA-directed RNA polymerase subunit beta'
VIAAQSVGEPGTQLTLKNFHQGGEAGVGDITQGLPRVKELLEARKPKGEAVLSEIAGTLQISQDKDSGKFTVKVIPGKSAEERIKIGDYQVTVENGAEVSTGDVLAKADDKAPLVAPFDGKVKVLKNELVIKSLDKANPADYEIVDGKMLRDRSGNLRLHDGDEIKAGDRLSGGSINLHQLMTLKGVEATQRYIINDVLRIYATQGQNIADKHLEIIVRQMFSRVQIEESGDSSFVAGDILSRAAVVDENEKLVANGDKPAIFTQLLLGITKVSIYSDSFLSAASFQDTTRVLIGAAISGKVDHLKGLKENVIIGRKIPVGTGVISEEEFYASETDGESIDEIPEA